MSWEELFGHRCWMTLSMSFIPPPSPRTVIRTGMMDDACGQILQPAWEWSWGYPRRTQWYGHGTIIRLQLQNHWQSSWVWGPPRRTKTRQKGWHSKSPILKQFQSHHQEDKQGVFDLRPQLLKYYHVFEKLKGEIKEVQVTYISWEVNDKADELARLATSLKPRQLKTFILHLVPKPSILGEECL